jgi:hypothetical protein
MKNKVMHCLKDSNLGKIEKYNKLVDFLAQKKNFLQLRMFNLGYSDARMDVLVSEVKKAYEIKDLDLYKFNVEDYEKQLQEKEQEVAENTGTENSKEPETELSEQETKFLEALKQNEDATAGLKLREEYPFLREESTPQELKALVTDKITAWYDFAEKHAELAELAVIENPNMINTVTELGKKAIEKFQLNADIKKELDFYNEKGKVLGLVPQTRFLKIDQELDEMSEADLVKHRLDAQKNKNKVKNPKNDNEKARLENWTYREKKASELLDTKFKK